MSSRTNNPDSSKHSSVVHGDQINIGDLSHIESLNIGSGKQTIVKKYGSDATELAALLLPVYSQIDRRPDDQGDGNESIARTVKDIELEAGKAQPNTRKTSLLLERLSNLAPDLLHIVLAALLDPSAGVATGVCKLARAVLDQHNRS